MAFFRKQTVPKRQSLAEQSRTNRPFSYYQTGGQTDPKVVHQKKPANKRRVKSTLKAIPGFLATISIIISLVYSLSLQPDPKLELIKPDAPAVTLLREQDEYQAAAKELLNNSILNRSKLTINTRKVETRLKEMFPEIAKVEVNLPLTRRRPIINFYAKELAVILVNSSGKYVLDKNGVAAVATKEITATSLELPMVEDQSGLEVGLGKQVLTAEEIEFIRILHYQLTAAKLGIQSMVLPPAAAELHVKLSNQPYIIKFSIKGDSRAAVGTLLATKAKLEKDQTVPQQYIDVRVEEKAYYK